MPARTRDDVLSARDMARLSHELPEVSGGGELIYIEGPAGIPSEANALLFFCACLMHRLWHWTWSRPGTSYPKTTFVGALVPWKEGFDHGRFSLVAEVETAKSTTGLVLGSR